MSIEAMKQALKALEKISKTEHHIERPPVESLEEQMRRIARKAITALRQAIADAEKNDSVPLYLTNEEIADIAYSCRWSNTYQADFAHAIEAKLREKNT
jgi:hypothetical protein